MKLKLLNTVVLLVLFWGSPATADRALDVSMVQLIATPDKYQGKRVQLVAFLHLEFEGNAIYLHKEDYDKSIHKNGLWIRLPDQKPSLSALSDNYVLVEGVFDANDTGHLGMWSGTISNVSRLELWNVH
jgi:hypothetical protein